MCRGGVLVITSICIITSTIFIYKNQNKFNPFLNSITELYTYNLNTPTWKTIDIVNQDKELYVLIIGESCRRDGLSLYNNTVDTTPFLNSVNKKYINYFISTAVNTTLSVPRLLALTDNQGVVAEENNILNIANESGLETYWISSQGYTGKYNISSSRISNFSKNKTFLKAGDDDLKLIPLLEKAIEKPSKKLIILHTMGSHINPKNRLYNFPQKIKTQKGDYIDAYLNSIRKTDYFLEQVYNVLAKSKKTFSIIYVSDHGVNINKNKNVFTEKRDDQKIQSYIVPFIQIDHNYTKSTLYNIKQSGYNFTKYFPTWIGVHTNITPKNYSIFDQDENCCKVMDYNKNLHSINEKSNGLTISEILN